jgi:hypothetical protein
MAVQLNTRFGERKNKKKKKEIYKTSTMSQILVSLLNGTSSQAMGRDQQMEWERQ